jgi:hypothetical protein
MTHQLLSGRLPFNDKRNPYNPALSAVLRSILTDKLDFDKACWSDISPEGIDFVKCVPHESPVCRQRELPPHVKQRGTHSEALQH